MPQVPTRTNRTFRTTTVEADPAGSVLRSSTLGPTAADRIRCQVGHPDEYGTERRRLSELEKVVADLTRRAAQSPSPARPLTHAEWVAGLTALLGRMGLAVPVETVNAPPTLGAADEPDRLPGQAEGGKNDGRPERPCG